MTIRLRPHHLLCMLTYVGKGYSPAFLAGYDAIIARLDAGEEALIVAGPDDICAPMLAQGHHCHEPRIARRDEEAADAVAALLNRPLAVGDTLSLDADTIARMRETFAAGTLRGACAGCQWSTLCTDIAASGYARVRLSPGRAVSPRPPRGTRG